MWAKRSILIVEDDEALRETLADHLAQEHGFATVVAGTLSEAEALINGKMAYIDAVILDVHLPDGDGRDFCAKLRREGHKMPILMLTGSDAEADVVNGLESGASDYIAKPFRSKELAARLRAQLRAFEETEDATFAIGPYKFRPSTKQLEDVEKKRRIKLTEKESAILKYLYRSDTRPVDRRNLLRDIWGHNPAVKSHTLETHIYRLRRKMEADPTRPAMLLTEEGAYRLNRASAYRT